MNLRLKQIIDVYLGKALLIANLIAVRGLGLLMRRNHSIQNSPEHILVIKILGLGSVVIASDAINSLKQKYPQAKVILMCGKSVDAGIKPLELFDELWVIDDSSLFALFKSGITALLKSWRLKKLWVIDLEVYSVLTTIFSAWTCAINRFGFQLSKTNFRNYLNTHNVYFNQFVWVDINYKNLVKAAGVESFEPFVFPKKFISSSSTKPYIAINNTCSELGGGLKKMPHPLWLSICNEVLQNTQYNIMLIGAPVDFESNQTFIKQYNLDQTRVHNNAGKLSFDEYYTFLGTQCALMITIDSGPLHIARKLKLPVVSLWGPTNPEQLQADTQSAYYLKKPCSPCIHHTEVVPCGGDNVCMKHMEIQPIQQFIQQQLKQYAHA